MVFSSLNFLFIFLPVLLPVYFLFAARGKRGVSNIILLIFSLFFYAYSTPKFIFIILASVLINCFSALIIDRADRKGLFLAICLVLNLGILGYFKYTGFVIKNINEIFGMGINIPEIVLPVGISFFTFQGLSYVIDVYRNDARVQKNPLNVALYISLFPQLIAGPIVRYTTVEKELTKRSESFDKAADGLCRFCFGLGKKVIIANNIGAVAAEIMSINYSLHSVLLTWLGVIAYTLQIYFDFSGYSDMAIGLGKVFGFNFPENFNYPYISKSITEFWRRWHISLSAWFRDYVYIPLGGNRVGLLKQIRNIMVVWLLTGLWHGAAWNFIFWGLYFGVLLLLEKFVYGKALEGMPSIIKHIYALIFIITGWGIFSAAGLGDMVNTLKDMFLLNNIPLISNEAIYYIIEYKAEFIIAIIASLPVKNIFLAFESNAEGYEWAFLICKRLFALAVLVLSVVYLVNSSFNPFIYFRF